MSKAVLLSTLRTNANVSSAEYTDTQVNAWLDDALNQHTSMYSFSTLPDREKDAVLLLAWIKVCYARASKASLYYSVGGQEGSTNKAEIVSNNLELARQLKEEYILLCGRLGINPAPVIIVSDVTIIDESVHGITPEEAHVAPNAVTLTAYDWTGTTVSLRWTEAIPRTTFSRYEIYYGIEAGLEDLTTLGLDSCEHLGVSETKATFIRSYTSIEKAYTRLDGLEANTDYYFVVVLVDLNGRISVSNEVSVGPSFPKTPASPTLKYLSFYLGGTLLPNTDYISNVSFSTVATIKSVSVNLQTAPSGTPCVIRIFAQAAGAGASFDTTVLAGSTSGANTGEFEITTSNALFLRTGTTGTAVGANVVIGYELEET